MPGMMRYIVWFGLVCFVVGLPKSVRQRRRSCLLGRDLRSLWQTDFATPPLEMTRFCSFGVICFGVGWSLTTLSTKVYFNLYPADPVDPVIRILSYHFTFPRFYRSTYILWGRMALICITLTSEGFPGVNLNLVRDDLRMMAPNAVAARDGAMKHIADYIGLFMRMSSN